MIWIMLLIVLIATIVIIFHKPSLQNEITKITNDSNSLDIIIPKLLDLVNREKHITLCIDNQYIKNKIGWYLNSYNFKLEYNKSDLYIANVEFYDREKKCGDIKGIILSINDKPCPIEIKEEYRIYKSSDIKKLSIMGLSHMESFTDKDLGKFYGYVKTDPDNIYDKFAIAIYTNQNKQIGYVPKENEYLFNTLNLIGGKEFVWGYIYKEYYSYNCTSKLMGMVHIPIKCSKAKIEKAKSDFKSKRIRKIVNY